MKTLHRLERCEVLCEADEFGGVWVSAVKFRGFTWYTRAMLEVWIYWGDWWLDPFLQGVSHTYYVLGTERGELTVYYCHSPRASECGWFAAGWYD